MANPQGINKARIQLQYKLYPSYENLYIIDSASHIIDVIPIEGSSYFIGSLNIPTEKNKEYVLEISIRDIMRGSSGRSYIYIDKRSENNSQNFKVYYADNLTQLFSSDLFNKKAVSIQYNRMPENNITVDQYITPLPLPEPPYIDSLVYKPVIPNRSYEVTFREIQNFRLEENRMYHFRIDPEKKEGLLLGYFGPEYPRITTVRQMMGPVKYISTDKEYLNILAKTNKKLAIDDFWLKIAGSTDRARELIRIFYSRVLFANYYFTGFSEGWRTDRGMIYLIFGNPEKIRRLNSKEIWSYSSSKRSENPEFEFEKVESVLSDNVFRLVRKNNYKNIWDQAIDSWRRGRVFAFSE